MLTRLLRRCRKEEGFTLIELLVVVAIIALLTAFAVPRIYDAISKAKASRGQGDMDTISGAIDRHYFDKNNYPYGPTADVQKALNSGYLKQTAKYVNGYNLGYVYLTDTTGSFYILADPQNVTTEITITCGTKTEKYTAGSAFKAQAVTPSTGIAATDVAAGCSVTGGTFITN